MEYWQSEIKKGIHHLSRHNPDLALKNFCSALNDCPVTEGSSLSRLLFYLGITLKRLGCMDSAIKSWLLSYRATKDRHSLKMIKRYANTYGMARQNSEDQDDWKAFYSVHLSRYLAGKKRRTFCCDAERDMIEDLIRDYWIRLKKEKALEGKDAAAKDCIFRKVNIVFPFVLIPQKCSSDIVYVDFRNSRRIGPDDRCPCGSGLSFMACCGRIPGARELLSGFI
jgi:hypothetical protein